VPALLLDDLQPRRAIQPQGVPLPLRLPQLPALCLERLEPRFAVGLRLGIAAHQTAAVDVQIEERLDHPTGWPGAQRRVDLRGAMSHGGHPAHHHEHVILGKQGGLERDVFSSQPMEKVTDGSTAEQVQVIRGLQHLEKSMVLGHHLLVSSAFEIARCLDEQDSPRVEQIQAVAHRSHRVGQVFEHVHERDHVERAWLDLLVLDRPEQHRDPERLPDELHDPGADLEARGVEARPPEHRHESPGAAAELEDPARRQLVPQHRPQPVEAAFGQIGPRADQDVGVAQIALLMREPVLAPVELDPVIDHARDLRPRHLAPH
jgi:hypothetical protein